jgi:N utilization substance protein A
MRGVRIQNVVQELQGEKIDVVQWHRDPAIFIANALNPAQVAHVDLNATENTARAVVQDRQLSLAIGKEGQNARLAAKLTGWKIDIISATEAEGERQARSAALAQQEEERRAKAQEGVATLVPALAPAPLPEPEPQVLRPAAQLKAPSTPMPVADVKERATKPAPTQAEPAMTAAEQEAWLLRVIAAEEAAQTEAEGEAEKEQAEEAEGVPITDDVWKVPVPVPSGSGQIRFAEDILGQRGGGRRGGRRGDGREDDTSRNRKGTAKRRRGPGQTEPRE